MSEKKKYILILIGIVIFFFYVIGAEVVDRWQNMYNLYGEMVHKEESLLDPQSLAEKKMNLLLRKKMLASSLTGNTTRYEQSETGVFEFLIESAKQSGVQFESLVPIRSEGSGEIKETSFKVSFATDYHHTGFFLRDVENGPLLLKMYTIELLAQSTSLPTLQVNAVGTAYILPKR